MAVTAAQNQTLVAILWPAGDKILFRNLVLVILGTLLLALSASVRVPFHPVPMTLQSLLVLLLGASYGWRLGGLTILAYLATGAAGLPVFSSGQGLDYMMGPPGGYLLGFLVAAIIVGALAERGFDRKIVSSLIMFGIGEALILACGVGYLASMIGGQKALLVGLVPFIPGDALKLGLAAALMHFIWRKVKT